MKRVVLISLICIYALSIGGVGIEEFYCCGKLTSVTVALVVTDKDTCAKGDNSDGCCKTKFQYFKVKDTHLLNGELGNLFTYPAEPSSFLSFYQDVSYVLSREVGIINGIHAPPLPDSVPIYLFICVFRV